MNNITLKQVHEWLEKQDAYTIHKWAFRKYERNKVIVSGIDEQWQVDVIDFNNLQKYNDNYKYALTCIDIFSKFAWCIAIKSKSADTTAEAFREILNSSKRKPCRLQSDAGKEFLGRPFQALLKEHNIEFFTVNSEVKCCIVERWNRTLKMRLWRYFTKNNTFRYLEVLPQIVTAYNHTVHQTIKCRPADVNKQNELEIFKRAFTLNKTPVHFKFSIGDKVRLNKYKKAFEKSYVSNWSEEIFLITNRHERHPVVYTIKDLSNEHVKGIFYEKELQKVEKIDNVYKVEKVLQKRKRNGKIQYFVKFVGYGDKFNMWVDKLIEI